MIQKECDNKINIYIDKTYQGVSKKNKMEVANYGLKGNKLGLIDDQFG
jgi:hypothetical protein